VVFSCPHARVSSPPIRHCVSFHLKINNSEIVKFLDTIYDSLADPNLLNNDVLPAYVSCNLMEGLL
jgi:hypothetical protein